VLNDSVCLAIAKDGPVRSSADGVPHTPPTGPRNPALLPARADEAISMIQGRGHLDDTETLVHDLPMTRFMAVRWVR
jgi:hypothetical protein